MLVDYWDPDSESFQIDRMSLTIEVEDINFIIGLSRWGEVVNLRSCEPGGGLTIDEYIGIYCYRDIKKVGSQIPTNSIQVHTRQDSKASLTPLGLVALDVLCSGVHETHSL